MKKTKVIVFMSMLDSFECTADPCSTALIQTDFVRISFGFIPLSLSSMLFGPVLGGICGVLSDLLGMIIAPKGAYFPGFTLSAFLTGAIYGVFLYRKPKNMVRISLAVLCVSIFVNLGLNTYWLTILQGKGYLVMLPERAIQNGIMSAIQIVLIPLVWRTVGKASRRDTEQPVRT